MNIAMFLFLAILAYLLTPGVLIVLPSQNSSRVMVAVTHALVLSAVYAVSHKAVFNAIGRKF